MGHRENLLTGAKQALFEKGYAHTTARDIVFLSGTNLGSIGYHYGSTEALLIAAMLSAMEDWGEAIQTALGEESDEPGDQPPDPMLRFWQRVIASVGSHRQLWLASIEVLTVAERNEDLRAQLAAGLREGRSGMAAMVTGIPEDQLDEHTVRTIGAAQMALMSGIVSQWLTDPESAPTAEEVVAGIRALTAVPTTPSRA